MTSICRFGCPAAIHLEAAAALADEAVLHGQEAPDLDGEDTPFPRPLPSSRNALLPGSMAVLQNLAKSPMLNGVRGTLGER